MAYIFDVGVNKFDKEHHVISLSCIQSMKPLFNLLNVNFLSVDWLQSRLNWNISNRFHKFLPVFLTDLFI